MGMGVLSGAVLGVFFGREGFLGGYDAWRRRLVRLGHIAFFGTGMLCILMAGTLERRPGAFAGEGVGSWGEALAWAMVAGAAAMPACCGLAAWRKGLTPVFVLPVVLIGLAVTGVYVGLWSAVGGV